MALSDRARKRVKLDFSEEFVILVGSEQKKYTVPKCLLTRTSKFFFAACNGDWKEAQDKTIKLPETTPELFSTYLQWIYIGDIVVGDEDPSMNNKDRDVAERRAYAYDQYKGLCEVAVLANELDDQQLRNAVTDAIMRFRESMNLIPSETGVTLVWEKMAPSSGLRKLLVDYYATRMNSDEISAKNERYPPGFFFEVAKTLKKSCIDKSTSPLVVPTYANRCKYHEHEENGPKCV